MLDLKAGSKCHVLKDLAHRAGDILGLDPKYLFDAVMERERLGSTGVGHGIAIPHAKLPELDHVVGLFARLHEPVDFESVDDQPVDLVFLLLAPDAGGSDHLKALARTARCLREPSLVRRLRGLDKPDEVYRLLTRKAETHAA